MRWSKAEYARYIQNTKQYTNNQKPKNKYYSQKTWIDGICFDSKKEADYYCQLKLLTRAGEIKGFCRQARFVVTEGVGSIERGMLQISLSSTMTGQVALLIRKG